MYSGEIRIKRYTSRPQPKTAIEYWWIGYGQEE